MENKVRIRYKDAENWTAVDGTVTYWGNFAQVYKDSRVVDSWIAPSKVVDTWNGKPFDVQHKRWDAHTLTFAIRESEVALISRLQSATSVIIDDLVKGISYTPDIQTTEYFEVGTPTLIANTTNYSITINFRTNPVLVNYAKRTGANRIVLYNRNKTTGESASVGSLSNGLSYMTPFEPVFNTQDTDKATFENNTGVNTLAKATYRKRMAMLIYTGETDANTLKKYCEVFNSISMILTAETVSGVGTVDVGGFGDELTFSDSGVALLLVPGQRITIGTEFSFISEVTSPDTATLETTIDTGTGLSYSIEKAYIMQEPANVQAELVAEGVYKCTISGNIETELFYPL